MDRYLPKNWLKCAIWKVKTISSWWWANFLGFKIGTSQTVYTTWEVKKMISSWWVYMTDFKFHTYATCCTGGDPIESRDLNQRPIKDVTSPKFLPKNIDKKPTYPQNSFATLKVNINYLNHAIWKYDYHRVPCVNFRFRYHFGSLA